MQEIKLENLNDGPGILPFKIGHARIISHYHSFLQTINLQDLQTKLHSIQLQIDTTAPELNNKTLSLFSPHLEYFRQKLKTLFNQLESLETKRIKRGLIDGLGSVVKSLTGNLDYTDALHYDKAIRLLKDSENQLMTEFNNHVSLTKEWSLQYSSIIDSLVSNQNKIELILDKIRQSVATNDNDLIKYAHLAQAFLILSDNIDSISMEITKIQNILAFIKTSVTHHSTLNPELITYIVSKLESIYGKEKIVSLELREFYDVIKLGYFYLNNSIIIVYKFPIFHPNIYDYYKLSVIPNKYNEILTPSSPYLVIHLKDYKYIYTACPRTSQGYMCEESPYLRNESSEDCIYQLITTQQKNATCKPVTVTLKSPAFEELDDKHYTVSFPHPTKVHLSCQQDLHQELEGSYLVIIPQHCYLETSYFMLSNVKDRLKGQAIKIMDLPKQEDRKSPLLTPFRLNSVNLEHLHATNEKISLQSPIQNLMEQNHSLYHTTIPVYVILISACVIISGLAYRRYHLKHKKLIITSGPDKQHKEDQRVYALPNISSSQPPAQFTTSVFNTRCSTGGGVTPA